MYKVLMKIKQPQVMCLYMYFSDLLQTIGGNIMTASPISDLNPLLQAAEAHVIFSSKGITVRCRYNSVKFLQN